MTAAPSAPEDVGARVDRAKSLLNAIGDTPLVDLSWFDEVPPGVRLVAKLETTNPGGSIKDRPVANMMLSALASGKLPAGRRLLDSSSGNAGIAYAQLGAVLGVPVTLVVPENASRERLDRIRAHGAELVLTDAAEGYDHALRTARKMAADEPERYWHCDQYANHDNWRAHYETTGGEILRQVAELAGKGTKPDAFVAGVGTGGTITGVGRRLREANPNVHLSAIVPEDFPGIEGLKPLSEPGDIVPEILDESLIDQRRSMSSEECAETCARLARRGLFVGPSSGGFVAAALRLSATRAFGTVVTILCDSGERYGSTGLWGRL